MPKYKQTDALLKLKEHLLLKTSITFTIPLYLGLKSKTCRQRKH